MANFYLPINAESIYHIYSRAVGQEKLFINEDNYSFFLKKYKLHISPVAATYAWCLLPNHFHFLIKTKSFTDIETYYKTIKGKNQLLPEALPEFMMERFSNWLNSYTKSFNKVNERKGSLFMDYMRRVPVLEDEQFGATVFYIHKNPVHHGLVHTIENWKWSSYKSFFSKGETALLRNEVLQWFQGLVAFENYHKQPVYLKKAVVAGE